MEVTKNEIKEYIKHVEDRWGEKITEEEALCDILEAGV